MDLVIVVCRNWLRWIETVGRERPTWRGLCVHCGDEIFMSLDDLTQCAEAYPGGRPMQHTCENCFYNGGFYNDAILSDENEVRLDVDGDIEEFKRALDARQKRVCLICGSAKIDARAVRNNGSVDYFCLTHATAAMQVQAGQTGVPVTVVDPTGVPIGFLGGKYDCRRDALARLKTTGIEQSETAPPITQEQAEHSPWACRGEKAARGESNNGSVVKDGAQTNEHDGDARQKGVD